MITGTDIVADLEEHTVAASDGREHVSGSAVLMIVLVDFRLTQLAIKRCLQRFRH